MRYGLPEHFSFTLLTGLVAGCAGSAHPADANGAAGAAVVEAGSASVLGWAVISAGSIETDAPESSLESTGEAGPTGIESV